jgi:hypothetical protein
MKIKSEHKLLTVEQLRATYTDIGSLDMNVLDRLLRVLHSWVRALNVSLCVKLEGVGLAVGRLF